MSRRRRGPGLGGEDALVAWLARAMPGGALLGHDAAVLEADAWAVTVDTQIAGVHVPADLDPARFARRLLAVNLSDLAATGAEPAYAFLALSVPRGFDHRRFFRALRRDAVRHGLSLAGGDLSTQPRATAALFLLGRRHPGGRWLRRGGARPSDVLWLGGTVGESALGLAVLEAGARIEGRSLCLPDGLETDRAARRAVRRHLEPRAQLDLGAWLATAVARGAAIDVSDGLAKDLHRLCRASDVGARVRLPDLPLAPRAAPLATRLGLDAHALALFGGEDYVLLFTLPADLRCPFPGAVPIGVIEARRGVRLERPGGAVELPDRGWDHLGPPETLRDRAPGRPSRARSRNGKGPARGRAHP